MQNFLCLDAFGFTDPAGKARHRIYANLLVPKEHPDYDRRHVMPPGWDIFNNITQFTSLRGVSIQDDKIVGYAEDIDKYTKIHALGDVLWLSYPVIFGSNLNELVDEIKRRGLYLFDIWGYVPGSGPGGYWQQFKPPTGVFDLLESKLGERWLGMDVGEQDGRYVGGYASQMYPRSVSRFEQYLNFQRYFEKMCDELGNKMSTLVSLNFGHYFLKEGIYTLIGAETAQALPNGQVYYAFIRGAGKQYGVPWFGNASIFNRWGYKVYGAEGYGEGAYGPTKGTSLNLLKRLMYNHILYNCMLVGFESSWFEGDTLSPIGLIQQAANRWVKENGSPGVMVTPIAVMLDFFSGWSFPRHLYSGDVYRVWGNLPYNEGDYLTDGVLDMIYPGYQNSSYFHDESGFISPTPYGDSADCILSDSALWLLERYPLVVIAGELSGGLETRDKLQDYVSSGGHLVITAGNITKFPDGIAGINVKNSKVILSEHITFEIMSLIEDLPFELYSLDLPDNARIIARCGNIPAIAEVDYGKGLITIFASPFGICTEPLARTIRNEVEKPLEKPYPLMNHVRMMLDRIFRRYRLFNAGEELSLITCRKGTGEYTLGICNNSLNEKPFEIVSSCGDIESISEIPVDISEKVSVGYLPEDFEDVDTGASTEKAIAGGDIRIFSVRVKEEAEILKHNPPKPRPRNRALPLRNIISIKEEILARPTFFEHFDSAVIDWKYLRQREKFALKSESGWISRQRLRIITDLTSGANLYADIRLVSNLGEDYASSMTAVEDVIAKMDIIGSRDLIISLHRHPENNFTPEQTTASFEETVKRICDYARKLDITVHLRTSPWKPPSSVSEARHFIKSIGADNLRIAPNATLMMSEGNITEEKIDILLLGSLEFDIAGRLWNINQPIAKYGDKKALVNIISSLPGALLALDCLYENRDQEYLDARALDELK